MVATDRRRSFIRHISPCSIIVLSGSRSPRGGGERSAASGGESSRMEHHVPDGYEIGTALLKPKAPTQPLSPHLLATPGSRRALRLAGEQADRGPISWPKFGGRSSRGPGWRVGGGAGGGPGGTGGGFAGGGGGREDPKESSWRIKAVGGALVGEKSKPPTTVPPLGILRSPGGAG